jgi:hypothetical protein
MNARAIPDHPRVAIPARLSLVGLFLWPVLRSDREVVPNRRRDADQPFHIGVSTTHFRGAIWNYLGPRPVETQAD